MPSKKATPGSVYLDGGEVIATKSIEDLIEKLMEGKIPGATHYIEDRWLKVEPDDDSGDVFVIRKSRISGYRFAGAARIEPPPVTAN